MLQKPTKNALARGTEPQVPGRSFKTESMNPTTTAELTRVRPGLFTRDEACRYLAVSRNTLLRFVAKCELPVVRLCRRLHFRRADLERFIETRRRAARNDKPYERP